MSADIVLIIYLLIILAGFFLDQILDFLNFRYLKKELHPLLHGIYDEEKYKKQQNYKQDNYRIGLLSSIFSLTIMLVMLLAGGFRWVDNIAFNISNHYIFYSLIFFGIIGIGMDIISTPFDIYDTFVIEKRYGFNRTTIRTYIFDKIKSWIIGAIIGGGLLSLIIYIYTLTPEYFWLLAWAVITIFSVFMNMFYSTLIVPLFNKQKPLEEGNLKNAIMNFASNAKFKIDNIYVIDGSKRSSKANAYFSGLGPKKRVVLYDTLIEEMETEEIVAVLAHEIGHYKKKHIISNLIMSVSLTGLSLFLLGLFLQYDVFALALGVEQASFHAGLIAFGIIFSPLSTITGLLANIISRKHEFEADNFAKNNYNANALISSLKKLTSHNLGNLTPHPAYVFVHYSHPPLLERLKNLSY
ncbi:MAG TPA: M48 family metallopeptidase [Bacteroidales bacterium]|nr:M48 family metallopeptidase [Bacteroidales bacterium]HRW20828.1 M48 family metallopeptidase [Bacteroidales bacterium]HXK81101.1 M48 family metallopeptidase [Bacteroidales bacterium]